tara:strand:+ start:13933 stop:15120 length:1188 start_codon:yes stop_codon:yes gene_type:complete
MKQFDVLIVGGALTGSVLTLALSQLKQAQSCSIGLVEAYQPRHASSQFDKRTVALNAGSVSLLKKWQLWELFQPHTTPISTIHVSDKGHLGMMAMHAEEFNREVMGYVAELEPVGHDLYRALTQTSVELFCPAKVVAIHSQADGHQVHLDHGEVLCCKLLIGADGAHSAVRQHLGVHAERVDFAQTAVVANITSSRPHAHCAFERFTEFGPLALLPMSKPRQMSMVWAMTPEQAQQRMQCSDQDFLQALQDMFGYRLGYFDTVSQRVAYPLHMTHMARFHYHRSFFVGNAAQTLHPIAGQGFNLGLRDIASWLDLIQLHPEYADDLGNMKWISAYVEARLTDKKTIKYVTELLVRVFSNSHPLLVQGRSMSLSLLSVLMPLKKSFARKAMGLDVY